MDRDSGYATRLDFLLWLQLSAALFFLAAAYNHSKIQSHFSQEMMQKSIEDSTTSNTSLRSMISGEVPKQESWKRIENGSTPVAPGTEATIATGERSK